MTVGEAARLVQLRIRETAGEEDWQQAKELVGYVLGIEPAALSMHLGMQMNDAQLVELGELAERRATGEPLQYILGAWEFMGLPMLVEPGVLIPRQDTEVLCEQAERLIRERGYQTVLDLCCGSGCIGVALNKRTGAAVTASDISPDCVRLTGENAALYEATLDVRQGDFLEPVGGERFDLILCNPPYLTMADMESLQKEVTFEPVLALYGGPDGLDFYRRMSREYEPYLNLGGALLLEIGATQWEAVAGLFPGARLERDYGGLPRVVIVEKENKCL